MSGEPVDPHELTARFALVEQCRHAILAVSGGADSTALMFLAAQWRGQADNRPALTVVTVDHGLRPDSARECAFVHTLAGRFAIPCHIRRWEGAKPDSRIQELARTERYRLLAETASDIGADAIVTAHTLDDQAETVLMRLARGSSIDGLGAMLPKAYRGNLLHLRPLLSVSKARLIATLQRACIDWIEDPSNTNLRFERPRIRKLLGQIEATGITPERLSLLAHRARRVTEALETMAEHVFKRGTQQENGLFCLPSAIFIEAPSEIRLRVLKKAIDNVQPSGGEYGIRLERLENLLFSLENALATGDLPFSRTLGGTMIRADQKSGLTIRREPGRKRV